MGAADVVPGVSGGTIAFITGIYEELIGSISAIDKKHSHYFLKVRLDHFGQKLTEISSLYYLQEYSRAFFHWPLSSPTHWSIMKYSLGVSSLDW